MGILLAAVALAVLAWSIWRVWGRPLLDLRNAIRAIANDETHQPIVRSTSRVMTQTAADLGRIADRLRRQNRQLADEGFSLRAILGSMVEGVVIADTGQRIRLANEALQEMFEFHRSPINRTVVEVFHSPELCAAVDRAIGEIRSVHLEIREDRIGTGAQTRHYRIQIAPLLHSGAHHAAGVLAVFNDVTELRALETVRREFVANVSHEFRTPLAIINGYVETLLDGALDDRPMTERSLEVILKNGKRLNFLIDDLLTVAQMERPDARLQKTACNLEDIARHVAERLEARIREKGMRVEMQFAVDAVSTEADARRIEQAFFNLMTNALQYTAQSDPELRISSRRKDADIEITFSDNGPGIPYKDQQHIFDRFYRVHKDRSRDAGGTGLGLSIVKNIAMAHGGHVSLRSTPGSGASFRIVLPADAVAAEART